MRTSSILCFIAALLNGTTHGANTVTNAAPTDTAQPVYPPSFGITYHGRDLTLFQTDAEIASKYFSRINLKGIVPSDFHLFPGKKFQLITMEATFIEDESLDSDYIDQFCQAYPKIGYEIYILYVKVATKQGTAYPATRVKSIMGNLKRCTNNQIIITLAETYDNIMQNGVLIVELQKSAFELAFTLTNYSDDTPTIAVDVLEHYLRLIRLFPHIAISSYGMFASNLKQSADLNTASSNVQAVLFNDLAYVASQPATMMQVTFNELFDATRYNQQSVTGQNFGIFDDMGHPKFVFGNVYVKQD